MTDITKRILEEIAAFQQELQAREEKEVKEITEQEYILLLSGAAACRMVPGIPENMGYEKMYYCKTEEDKVATREFLKRLDEIEDLDTLEAACAEVYNTHRQYEQFQTFWDGNPLFDINQLEPHGLRVFTKCIEYAELFRPFVGGCGFMAWDYNEQIGMARRSCACGLITEEEFWDFTKSLSLTASAYFNSWEEYAISFLCGGVYFMFRENDYEEEKVQNYYEICRKILSNLLEDGGAWDRNGWYKYQQKNWAIPVSEMKELLVNREGAAGCLATDRILVDGCKVGYMYREEPEGDWDSGWRFTAGDESDEYMDDPDNSGIYTLNTVCNSDPEIIPLLNAPCGTAYFRDEEDGLVEVEFNQPEDED